MIFSSTIIPTINRSSLDLAVQSVLDQGADESSFEIIVVNDSGRPLPEKSWHRCTNVRILNTNHRERSVARNTGAAIALGGYLHFLDDDDWLLPEAFEAGLQLSKSHPEADWLLAGSRLVDRKGNTLIELHHDLPADCFVQAIAGEWLPLQSSFIKKSAFFNIGGFNPLITASEDIDLARRILLRGQVAESRQVIACIGMGIEKSTTDHDRLSPQSRLARENILEEATAFGRMRTSASTPYWSGRIVRAYLTSTVWNIRHRRPSTAASRLSFAVIGVILATPRWLTPAFWAAILRSYQSPAFKRGFEAAESLTPLPSTGK